MYVNKWTTFAFSIVAQNNAGLAYVFSLYSDQIKQRFGLHQNQVLQCTGAAVCDACRAPTPGAFHLQVEALASACNFGGYLSIFSGLVYDALGHRHGLGPRYCSSPGRKGCHHHWVSQV